jgi:hypothetical protein
MCRNGSLTLARWTLLMERIWRQRGIRAVVWILLQGPVRAFQSMVPFAL